MWHMYMHHIPIDTFTLCAPARSPSLLLQCRGNTVWALQSNGVQVNVIVRYSRAKISLTPLSYFNEQSFLSLIGLCVTVIASSDLCSVCDHSSVLLALILCDIT